MVAQTGRGSKRTLWNLAVGASFVVFVFSVSTVSKRLVSETVKSNSDLEIRRPSPDASLTTTGPLVCGKVSDVTRIPAADMGVPVQFIYLVAVEGAGHHGLAAVLQHALENAGKFSLVRVRWSEIRRAFSMVQDGKTAIESAKNSAKSIIEAAAKRAERDGNSRVVIIEDRSFPSSGAGRRGQFYQPGSIERLRNGQHHPYHLKHIYRVMAPVAEVKFIVLYRDFVNTVWSHPQWDNGIVNHSKTLVTFLQWLSEVLIDFPCDLWKSIRYEHLVKAAEEVKRYGIDSLPLDSTVKVLDSSLTSFFDWPEGVILNGIEAFKPSNRSMSLRQHVEAGYPGLVEASKIDSDLNSTWLPFNACEQRVLSGIC